jgi:hypothetical protein
VDQDNGDLALPRFAGCHFANENLYAIGGGDMEISPAKCGSLSFHGHNKSKSEEAGDGNGKGFTRAAGY